MLNQRTGFPVGPGELGHPGGREGYHEQDPRILRPGKGVLTLHVSNLTEDDLEMVTHPLGFNYLSEHINYFTGFLEPFKDYVDRVTFSP
jgi:hypothetical protein